MLGVDELVLQRRQSLVVQIEAELQGAVRYPPLSLKELADLA
jgi:hypothetical protein